MVRELSADELAELLDEPSPPHNYEWIDQFILENCKSVGAIFASKDVEAWRKANDHDFDTTIALQAHRVAPKKRTFTTKRVGLGRYSHYVVVEAEAGVWPDSVREMHTQQGQEAVKRWANEMKNRMWSISLRNPNAIDLLDQATIEMTLVASIFDMKLQAMIDEMDLKQPEQTEENEENEG
jgi:hypothetical protein